MAVFFTLFLPTLIGIRKNLLFHQLDLTNNFVTCADRALFWLTFRRSLFDYIQFSNYS